MKPSYFFRKVRYPLWTQDDANSKKIWNRLKDKDCVVAVTKLKRWKYLIAFDSYKTEYVCFAKDDSNRLYLTGDEDNVKFHLKKKKLFFDKDKWVLMEI